ncbi:hypothetical protein AGDE_14053 [Angomonas deanei]|nr:hypothetical protein AGDE_14053 [Angomonas deanei]|eukprot:EPY21515.1 hypothetical protein AGDE_14053 [Angomonas deanei]
MNAHDGLLRGGRWLREGCATGELHAHVTTVGAATQYHLICLLLATENVAHPFGGLHAVPRGGSFTHFKVGDVTIVVVMKVTSFPWWPSRTRDHALAPIFLMLTIPEKQFAHSLFLHFIQVLQLGADVVEHFGVLIVALHGICHFS